MSPVHQQATWCLARLLLALPVLAACQGPNLHGPVASAHSVSHAWVQAADNGRWVARAMTSTACPALQVDGQLLPMAERVGPAVVPARAGGPQADVREAAFAQRVCEATLPAGASQVLLDGRRLPSPPTQPRRIVLVGDTGCRMKQSENAFQDCNDPVRWPFATVARQAAAWHPDLVIHVGDVHYRESPCPAGRAGCAGSPWGYGEVAWLADFMQPAQALLQAAPWVMVRGNHESCSRAGVGWFRYLDAAPWRAEAACVDPALDAQAEYTPPFAVALDAQTQLLVFDSASVPGKPHAPQDPALARLTSRLQALGELAARKPHNIVLHHHPVLAFAGGHDGQARPGHAGLMAAMRSQHPQRLYAPGVDLVLNGHVHLFEALGFASDHPSTLVIGNSGSAMEGHIDPSDAQGRQPAPGAVVSTFVTHAQFGYATLERPHDAGPWVLTAWSTQGAVMARCQLAAGRLSCPATPPGA